ncbi:unnamed protein product [Angiostrongylus costaricensis]|uniref:non-specific serine/threonine protein kinase n=1 Tax=Angiostrongylus costaricensis TaxID=334426 RepID=A0A0R3PMQ0_ANGCS|nr:unnamed protein product [Angiostrongylus costaricensis]
MMEFPLPSNFVILCESPRKPMDSNNNSSLNRASKIAARKTSRVYPAGFEVLRPRLVTGTNIPIDQRKGVFGEAVEVESLEDGQHYAIKRALRTFESSTSRQNKLREVLVHESIPHHTNILRLEKAWEERGRLYIQTELCSGNLADYRRNFGLLTENELYLVLLSVLKAVEHLHSLSILHLDIKPSNILIHESSCKLGDFGLAYNLMQNPTGYGEEGDKYYMAPEILNSCPTTAADIYSVGVTMLEVNLSTDLIQLIKSMLVVNPLKRPSAGKLLHDLERNARPLTRFRTMENSPADSSLSGVEDVDWNFDITGTLSKKFEILIVKFSSCPKARKLTYQSELPKIRSFRSRLDFNEDDSDCGASKKLRRCGVSSYGGKADNNTRAKRVLSPFGIPPHGHRRKRG